MSNMRSTKAATSGLEGLWATEHPTAPARGRPVPRATVEEHVWIADTDDFAARGWGQGTVFHYEPARRGERGALVVARFGGRTRVGEFVSVRGRPVLRTDVGSDWLPPTAEVIGLVRMVEPPLLAG